MSELLSHLRANCASEWSGRVWLDIEGSQYWTGDVSANQNWYRVSTEYSRLWWHCGSDFLVFLPLGANPIYSLLFI